MRYWVPHIVRNLWRGFLIGELAAFVGNNFQNIQIDCTTR
jgi:hypothetical protein